MSKPDWVEHEVSVDGNVFAALGFPPEEAKRLLEETDREIAARQAMKERLMEEIAVWMKQNRLRQVDAAAILGVQRPRVSDVVRKKSGNFTIDSLIGMLARTGKRVEISVR